MRLIPISETLLAESFKQDQGDAIGEIQGARVRIEHRDAQPAVTIFFKQRFGHSCGFAAKDQIVVSEKFCLRIKLGAARFDKPQARCWFDRSSKCSPVFPSSPDY